MPTHLHADPSATNMSAQTKNSENTSSINLIVGTGCFKKDKVTKNLRAKDKISAPSEDAKELPNSNVTDTVTAWLSKLEIDSKATEKQEASSVESFENYGNFENSRSRSGSTRNLYENSKPSLSREEEVCKVMDVKVKKIQHVRFSTKDNLGRSIDNLSSSRMYKSSKESVVAKWNTVEKFMCTGQKMNAWTREQVRVF